MADKKPMTPKQKGVKKYGDVKFALPAKGEFPIDTPAHVRNAEARLHQSAVQGNLSDAEVATAERNIRKAATHTGVAITAKPARKK